MLNIKQKSIKLKEQKNYGSSLHPLYTIAVTIEIAAGESPDMLHKLFSGTGLITRETVPFEVVPNFRGSADNKPFYSAVIIHEGIIKEYEVLARDTGGSIKSGIHYEPVVYPEELRLIHPAEFARVGIEVKEWELRNYKHFFMRFIASKRYESFDMQVKRETGGGAAFTAIKINIIESELKAKKVPCLGYLKRLEVFEDLDFEEEVKREIGAV